MDKPPPYRRPMPPDYAPPPDVALVGIERDEVEGGLARHRGTTEGYGARGHQNRK